MTSLNQQLPKNALLLQEKAIPVSVVATQDPRLLITAMLYATSPSIPHVTQHTNPDTASMGRSNLTPRKRPLTLLDSPGDSSSSTNTSRNSKRLRRSVTPESLTPKSEDAEVLYCPRTKADVGLTVNTKDLPVDDGDIIATRWNVGSSFGRAHRTSAPRPSQRRTDTAGSKVEHPAYPTIRLLSISEAQVAFNNRRTLKGAHTGPLQSSDRSYTIYDVHPSRIKSTLPQYHYYALLGSRLVRIKLAGGEGLLSAAAKSLGISDQTETGTETKVKTRGVVVERRVGPRQVGVSLTGMSPTGMDKSRGSLLLSAFKEKSAIIKSRSESESQSPTTSISAHSEVEFKASTKTATNGRIVPDIEPRSTWLSSTGENGLSGQDLLSQFKERSAAIKSRKEPRSQSPASADRVQPGGTKKSPNKLSPTSCKSQSQSLLSQFKESNPLSETPPYNIAAMQAAIREVTEILSLDEEIQTSPKASLTQLAQTAPDSASPNTARSSPNPLPSAPQTEETKSLKLTEFANRLASLTSALHKAIEILPQRALEDLEDVLENDWMVEDMEKMVMGVISYVNGRGKEGERKWRSDRRRSS